MCYTGWWMRVERLSWLLLCCSLAPVLLFPFCVALSLLSINVLHGQGFAGLRHASCELDAQIRPLVNNCMWTLRMKWTSRLGGSELPSWWLAHKLVERLSLISTEIGWMFIGMGFPCGSAGKESACSAGDLGLIPGVGRSLEKGMATHSSILAWRTPRTEEPGRLQSMGLQRATHNWTTNPRTFYWCKITRDLSFQICLTTLHNKLTRYNGMLEDSNNKWKHYLLHKRKTVETYHDWWK